MNGMELVVAEYEAFFSLFWKDRDFQSLVKELILELGLGSDPIETALDRVYSLVWADDSLLFIKDKRVAIYSFLQFKRSLKTAKPCEPKQ